MCTRTGLEDCPLPWLDMARKFPLNFSSVIRLLASPLTELDVELDRSIPLSSYRCMNYLQAVQVFVRISRSSIFGRCQLQKRSYKNNDR